MGLPRKLFLWFFTDSLQSCVYKIHTKPRKLLPKLPTCPKLYKRRKFLEEFV